MKRKSFVKVVTLIIIFTTMILIGKTTEVNAALQATVSTHNTKRATVTYWMTNFRNMEKTGEAMGLDEELNEDLTSKTSNNIDVHMIRSTEYGAIAILSASGYGNSKKIQESEIRTTTGNITGIYMFPNTKAVDNEEIVAGGMEGKIFSGVDSRYFDVYGNSTTAKVGDALGGSESTNPGCAFWHGATRAGWVSNVSYPYFIRGYKSLFCFQPTYSHSGWYDYLCHGVAVCGEGL